MEYFYLSQSFFLKNVISLHVVENNLILKIPLLGKLLGWLEYIETCGAKI